MSNFKKYFGVVLEDSEGNRSVDLYDTREEALEGHKVDKEFIIRHGLEGIGIYLTELEHDKSEKYIHIDILINETSILLYQS